jgi:hypothetical protein
MNKNFLLKINVLFVSEVMSTVFAHFISWTRQTLSLLKFSWLNIFLTISDNTCVFKDPFVYTLEFICLGVFESTVHFKIHISRKTNLQTDFTKTTPTLLLFTTFYSFLKIYSF